MENVNINYRILKWHAIKKLANDTLNILDSNRCNKSSVEMYKINSHAACVLRLLLSDLESKGTLFPKSGE